MLVGLVAGAVFVLDDREGTGGGASAGGRRRSGIVARGWWTPLPPMRRVAIRLVMEPAPKFVLGGQREFGGDGDIARLHIFVGVLQDADLPAAFGRDDLRARRAAPASTVRPSDARFSVSSSASSARRASSTIRGRIPRRRSMSSVCR